MHLNRTALAFESELELIGISLLEDKVLNPPWSVLPLSSLVCEVSIRIEKPHGLVQLVAFDMLHHFSESASALHNHPTIFLKEIH